MCCNYVGQAPLLSYLPTDRQIVDIIRPHSYLVGPPLLPVHPMIQTVHCGPPDFTRQVDPGAGVCWYQQVQRLGGSFDWHCVVVHQLSARPAVAAVYS